MDNQTKKSIIIVTLAFRVKTNATIKPLTRSYIEAFKLKYLND